MDRGVGVDRDLVEQARSGDRDAFAVLAAATVDRLYAIARVTLRDSDRAEDAVQETLVRSWRDLPSLREWVRDGDTGYLVDAQDASAVAARVCAVLENPERRRQVVQQARALVVDKASQVAHMSVMTGHYRRLAAER